MPSIRRLHLAILALGMVLIASTLAYAEDHDRWYVVQMQGKRAGWMHGKQSTEGGLITTSSELRMALKRGDQTVDIAVASEFVETLAGKPVRGRASMSMASTPNVAEYTFKEGEVEVTSGSGTDRVTTTTPLPEGHWLTPAAMSEFVSKRLEAGAESFQVRSLDITTGVRAVTTTHRVLERTTADALGKAVPAVKWVTTTDAQPGIQSVEFVDERGVPIRTEVDLGEVKMVLVLADKQLAQLEVDPPELMNSTLVSPKGKVQRPRSSRKASYLLSVATGSLADFPSIGTQTSSRVDDRTVRVVVDLDKSMAAEGQDAQREEYRAASQMINSGDEVVAGLTKEALEGVPTDDDRARVEALRKAVYKHIKNKSFGVGFASAAEVARTRTGDCSEHAALLTAMLRNAGYAARTVSGLVYVEKFAEREGVFGYHMWSQVLIAEHGAKHWLDLDGTMPAGKEYGPGGFDATHITIATSSLADGDSINELVALAPLLGRLRITIE